MIKIFKYQSCVPTVVVSLVAAFALEGFEPATDGRPETRLGRAEEFAPRQSFGPSKA